MTDLYSFECKECPNGDRCRLVTRCTESAPLKPVNCPWEVVSGTMGAIWKPVDGITDLAAAPRPVRARARVRVCGRDDDEGASRGDGA